MCLIKEFSLANIVEEHRIREIMQGLYTPNLYRFVLMEIFMDENFQMIFNKSRPKNVGLVHLFNEKFMENLVVRTLDILSKMEPGGGLLDSEYYHKNRGIQQMSEFIQTEVENQMDVMSSIGEEVQGLEKYLNIKKGKLPLFYPIVMWWKSSEDIKREEILTLKQAMLKKAMNIVADSIINIKTTVFEFGFLLQYEPIIELLRKQYPALAKNIVLSHTNLEDNTM